jgi:hypothetical protein
MTLLCKLTDIPKSLPSTRFMLRFSESKLDAEVALDAYCVTDQLAGVISQSLRVILNGIAKRPRSSKHRPSVLRHEQLSCYRSDGYHLRGQASRSLRNRCDGPYSMRRLFEATTQCFRAAGGGRKGRWDGHK